MYFCLFITMCPTLSVYFSPPARPLDVLWEFYFYDLWYTRILHESFKHFNVWLYATFDGVRPLLIFLFFARIYYEARIYYDSFMFLAYGFMPLPMRIEPFWSCCSLHVFIAMLVFITNYEKIYAYRIIRLKLFYP